MLLQLGQLLLVGIARRVKLRGSVLGALAAVLGDDVLVGAADLVGDLLGGLLGGRAAGVTDAGANAPSGMAAMLDMNGDGNPLDDILRMAGKAFG